MRWMSDEWTSLFTDQYELTMLQAYWKEQMFDSAVFSFFVRKLKSRNYLLAAGLDDALHGLENLQFPPQAIDYLRSLNLFDESFLEWLGSFHFTGNVYAVPEGTPIFANEPLVEVDAPLPEAQLAETFIMNQVHLQTLLASKAARVVAAAQGRPIVDFGLRRMHGADAGLKSARAFYLAGVKATSNVVGGFAYGIPISGTMAHSYIQAHDSEMEAFRAFATCSPETILLVDTYDTLQGVRRVIALANEWGSRFRVRGIRLDSGDLLQLSLQSRRLLDEAGLNHLQIFASGSLDEYTIDQLLRDGAPIDGFGVGTRMGVSNDVPAFDCAYKLTSYAGQDRIKDSPGKPVLPGRKQIFRVEEHGKSVRDILALSEEEHLGRPLIRQVMQDGKRVDSKPPSLDELRQLASAEIAALPKAIQAITDADPPYPVEISDRLKQRHQEARGISNQ